MVFLLCSIRNIIPINHHPSHPVSWQRAQNYNHVKLTNPYSWWVGTRYGEVRTDVENWWRNWSRCHGSACMVDVDKKLWKYMEEVPYVGNRLWLCWKCIDTHYFDWAIFKSELLHKLPEGRWYWWYPSQANGCRFPPDNLKPYRGKWIHIEALANRAWKSMEDVLPLK